MDRPTEPAAASRPAGADETVRVVSPWNVANALTAVRFLLVPLFAWFLLVGDGRLAWRWAAAGTFVLAILTDRLDGEVARRHGLITDVGKIADPIADKALVGTALVGLSVLGELPWWVTVLVLAREVLITGLRFVLLRRAVLPAGRGGKLKTVLQAVAIATYLVPLPEWGKVVAALVMAAAVVVTLVTGADYLAKMWRIVRPRGAAG